jgi:hypothetical protein
VDPDGKRDPNCTFSPSVTRKAEELIKRDRAEKRSVYVGLYEQVGLTLLGMALAHTLPQTHPPG